MTIDLSLGAHDWAIVLLRVVVQGALGFGLIWVCGKAIPRVSPSIRCWLWWLGCAAMLAGFAVSSPIQLHLLPAHAARAMIVPHADAGAASVLPASERLPPAQGQVAAATRQPTLLRFWLLLAEAIWSTGVLLGALRLVCGLIGMFNIVRRSEPLDDTRLLTLLRDLSSRLRLNELPDIRLSESNSGPQVVWAWGQAIVLLPSHMMQAESDCDLRLALAHELAHVRRRDLTLGWVPAMAELIFWFDPLVRIAVREYRQAREEACDADALRITQVAPDVYARLLLQLGVRLPLLHLAALGAAPSISTLRRRLANLDQGTQRLSPVTRIAFGLVAALACTLPCVRLVAQQDASSAPAPSVIPAPTPVADSPSAPMPAAAVPSAVVPAVPPASPQTSVHSATVSHQPQRQSLPPMPVYVVPAHPQFDEAWRAELEEAKRARTSITPQQLAELRIEADEAKRDVRHITPQERAAWHQAIVASRAEVASARQEALAEAIKSQAEATTSQEDAIRRQVLSLRSQAFKRAIVDIDQAHLGKTLAEALKNVPVNINTTEIERHVDAALENLPKEMDGIDALPSAIPTGKKIVIDHPGRYVVPKGSGVIINIPLHHVNIVGDTMTVD